MSYENAISTIGSEASPLDPANGSAIIGREFMGCSCQNEDLKGIIGETLFAKTEASYEAKQIRRIIRFACLQPGRKLRILVAGLGPDGHDHIPQLLALAFRDAGLEVIYTGYHLTPEQIVSTAIQEDVDMITLSISSTAHTCLFPTVLELLKENSAEDITVIGNGIFSLEDVSKLKETGIKEIFKPGTRLRDVTSWVSEKVKPGRAMLG